MIKLLSFVLFLQGSFAAVPKIPDYVKLCKKNDPQLSECFTNSMLELLPYLKEGIPELRLPGADPFRIDQLNVPNIQSKNLNLDFSVSNGSLYNLGNIKFENMKIELDPPRWRGKASLDNSKVKGSYKIKGKVILFDIDTAGHAEINIPGLVANMDLQGEYFTKNRKQHIKFTKCSFLITKFDVDFDFKSNSNLSPAIELAIKENSKLLSDEFKPYIEEIICSILLQYTNKVHNRYSVDKLYPD